MADVAFGYDCFVGNAILNGALNLHNNDLNHNNHNNNDLGDMIEELEYPHYPNVTWNDIVEGLQLGSLVYGLHFSIALFVFMSYQHNRNEF